MTDPNPPLVSSWQIAGIFSALLFAVCIGLVAFVKHEHRQAEQAVAQQKAAAASQVAAKEMEKAAAISAMAQEKTATETAVKSTEAEKMALATRLAATEREKAAVEKTESEANARLSSLKRDQEKLSQASLSIFKVPAGCRAVAGTSAEPYTRSGWAREVIHEVTGIELVYVPAGDFTMGSPTTEAGRGNDETPHQVTISKGFYLGKTEVTQGQWTKLMRTGLKDQVRLALKDDTVYYWGSKKCTFRELKGCQADADSAELIGNEAPDLPMYYVSWDDSLAFCQQGGGGLRLPTEAEWEYACRALSGTALCSGDMAILGKMNAPALDRVAWYGGNSSVGYEGKGWDTADWTEKQYPGGNAGPRRVGTKQANAWGLYDMHGNVWELCQDWYGDYPINTVTDPSGPITGVYRVSRGGSWNRDAGGCRTAYRSWYVPGIRYINMGFRVALAPAVR